MHVFPLLSHCEIDVLKKEHLVSISSAGNLGKTAAIIHKMLQQALGNTTSSNSKTVLVTFKLNFDAYNMSTRQKYNFHQPSSNLSLYKKYK